MSANPVANVARTRRVSVSVSRPGLMALEPRMLFDGAVGATAGAVFDVYDEAPEAATPVEINSTPAPANQAPIANPDHRIADADSGPLTGNVITGAAPGDVADTDPDGDAFAVFGVVAGNQSEVPLGNVGTAVQGDHGSLVMHDDGSYTYTPDASVSGLAAGESVDDHFGYLVCDDFGNISTTTLTLTFRNPADVTPDPAPVPAPTPTPTPVDPPVEVAPPTPQPILPVPQPPAGTTDPGLGGVQPLPPVSGNSGPDRGDPFAGRTGDGTLATQSAPFTLLSAESGQPVTVDTGNVFAPFAPAAVLGMVETSPERDNRLGKAPVAMVDGDQPTAESVVKPEVVKKASLQADAQSDQKKSSRFSDQIRDTARLGAPLTKTQQ